MAREYARVKLSIWADDDFRELSAGAQGLYFVLLTSPTLSLCGVADWRPKRLAGLAKGWTARQVQTAAQELVSHGYIVTDDDTEEVLVRSFMRHDGVLKSPNITVSMVKDFAAVTSAILRRTIVDEMVRLREKYPDWAGWAKAEDVLANHPINGSEVVSNRFPEQLEIGSGNRSPIPQPSALSLQPSTKSVSAKKATALPDDWKPSDAHRSQAADLGVNVDLEAQKMRDYALANGRTQKDWDAFFRNWLRNSLQFGGAQRPRPLDEPDPNAWMRRRPGTEWTGQ